jgi:hypothetical protein
VAACRELADTVLGRTGQSLLGARCRQPLFLKDVIRTKRRYVLKHKVILVRDVTQNATIELVRWTRSGSLTATTERVGAPEGKCINSCEEHVQKRNVCPLMTVLWDVCVEVNARLQICSALLVSLQFSTAQAVSWIMI